LNVIFPADGLHPRQSRVFKRESIFSLPGISAASALIFVVSRYEEINPSMAKQKGRRAGMLDFVDATDDR